MTVEELFHFVEENDIGENQEETALIERVTAKMPDIDKIPPAGEPEPMSLLYDLINYERETAFKVGFQTAVSLILEGKAKD